MTDATSESRGPSLSSASAAPSVNLRWHALALGVLLFAGLLRGLFWVAVTDVWHADEASHYAYVHALAAGEGIPMLGTDRVPDEVTLLAKESPTRGNAATEVSASAQDPRWGAFAEQYEAGQGPLYYSLLAVVLGLLGDAGTLTSLFALRTASLLLTLTAVPLLWLLGRSLFPRAPAAWLLAPALLICWQSFNASGATVTNDALAWPLALGALIGVALALRRGPTPANAALTGLSAGLALLNKGTAASLLPTLAVGGLVMIVYQRPRPRSLATWVAVAGSGTLAPLVPWVAWQREVYGDRSVVQRFNEILGPHLGPPQPLNRATVTWYFNDVSRGLFGQEFFSGGIGPYSATLTVVAVVVALCGIALACVRRRWLDAFGLSWLLTALPLGFVALIALVQVFLGGVGTIAARYLHPTLAALALAAVASLVMLLGARAGTVAVAVVAAVALQIETGPMNGYVSAVYLRGLPVEGITPALVQELADGTAQPREIEVTPPCPARFVGVAYKGDPPSELPVSVAGAPAAPAPLLTVEPIGGEVQLGYFELPHIAAPFAITTAGGPPIAVSSMERSAALRLSGASGDPVLRVLCEVADPRAVRFSQTHHPQHPDLSYGAVTTWPRAWALAGWALVALAVVGVGVDGLLARRRRTALDGTGALKGSGRR